jgi:hypothetical protein
MEKRRRTDSRWPTTRGEEKRGREIMISLFN